MLYLRVKQRVLRAARFVLGWMAVLPGIRVTSRTVLPGSVVPLHRLLREPFALFVSQQDWGEGVGGVERYQLEDMRACNARGIRVFQIFPSTVRRRWLSVKWKRRVFGLNVDDRPFVRRLPMRRLPRVLRTFHRSGQRTAVNVHHLLHWKDREVRTLLRGIREQRILVYAHDMYLCCPSVHFLLDGRTYCGILENDGEPERCPACSHGAGLERHRALFRPLLDAAERVITPSPVVSRALRIAYPRLDAGKIRFFEHQEAVAAGEKPAARHPRKRLAFVGAGVAHKGWEVFERLSGHPDVRRRYDLYHLGEAVSGTLEGVVHVPFSIRGPEGVQAGVRLLLEHEIDAVLLLSVVPESYSYTLHEALAAGVPVLAFRQSGNIAHKILEKKVYGAVFRREEELLGFLRDDTAMARFLRENTNPHLSTLRMKSAFLAWFNGA